MKINNLDFNIEWFSSRILPDSVKIESDFPSYNITIKDEKDNLIEQIKSVCEKVCNVPILITFNRHNQIPTQISQ